MRKRLLQVCLAVLLVVAVALPAAAEGPGTDLRLVGQTAGSLNAVVVNGDYAYLAIGMRLVVVDVSNPANPWLVSGYDVDGPVVYAAAVDGTTVYYIGRHEFRVFDLSSPTSPQEIGTCAIDDAGFEARLVVAGGYAYVSTALGYLLVVDVRDGTAPAVMGQCAMSYAKDMAAQSSYVYLASGGNGLRVVDVSDPTAPAQVGSCAGGPWYDVDVSGSIAAVAGEYGLAIIDVSSPTAPTHMGGLDTGFVSDVAIGGSTAHVALDGGAFVTVAISHPSTPAELGRLQTPGFVSNVLASDGVAYLITSGPDYDTWLIDATAPALPRQLGKLGSYGWRLAAANGFAYVKNTASLQVFDVSIPAAPQAIGYLAIDGERIAVEDTRVYLVSDYMGLHIVDVSTPTHPTKVGSCDIAVQFATGVAVGDGIACIADYRSGLHIVDVSDPTSPSVVGHYPMADNAMDVAIVGNTAIVLSHGYEKRLELVDISDPRNPTQASCYGQFIYCLDVSGTLVYASTSTAGLEIIDVSNPSSPMLVGSHDRGAGANELSVDGDYVYVAAGSRGLVILGPADSERVTIPLIQK